MEITKQLVTWGKKAGQQIAHLGGELGAHLKEAGVEGVAAVNKTDVMETGGMVASSRALSGVKDALERALTRWGVPEQHITAMTEVTATAASATLTTAGAVAERAASRIETPALRDLAESVAEGVKGTGMGGVAAQAGEASEALAGKILGA